MGKVQRILNTPFRQALIQKLITDNGWTLLPFIDRICFESADRDFSVLLIQMIDEDIIPDEPQKSRKNRDDQYEARGINCHTDIFWAFLSIT